MKKILACTSLLALCACGGDFKPVSDTITPDEIRSANNVVTRMDTVTDIATLDEVKFNIADRDSYVKFSLDSDGKIAGVTEYTRDDNFTGAPTYAASEKGTFERVGDTNVFTKKLYVYSFDLDNTSIPDIAKEYFGNVLSFKDESNSLTANQIKDRLKEKLLHEINYIRSSQPGNDLDLDNALAEYRNQIMTAFDSGNTFWSQTFNTENLTVTGLRRGLRFADFGLAEISIKDANGATLEDVITPYAGGYTSHEVANVTTNTTFNGTTIAKLTRDITTSDNSVSEHEEMLLRDDHARLTVNTDGSTALVMESMNAVDPDHAGKYWYNVTVSTATDGSPTFLVGGGINNAGNFGIAPDTYTFSDTEFKDSDQQYVQVSSSSGPGLTTTTTTTGSVGVNMFGADAITPSEAVSTFGLKVDTLVEEAGVQTHSESSLYGAFGGTH